jgi:hypothetical protein
MVVTLLACIQEVSGSILAGLRFSWALSVSSGDQREKEGKAMARLTPPASFHFRLVAAAEFPIADSNFRLSVCMSVTERRWSFLPGTWMSRTWEFLSAFMS